MNIVLLTPHTHSQLSVNMGYLEYIIMGLFVMSKFLLLLIAWKGLKIFYHVHVSILEQKYMGWNMFCLKVLVALDEFILCPVNYCWWSRAHWMVVSTMICMDGCSMMSSLIWIACTSLKYVSNMFVGFKYVWIAALNLPKILVLM